MNSASANENICEFGIHLSKILDSDVKLKILYSKLLEQYTCYVNQLEYDSLSEEEVSDLLVYSDLLTKSLSHEYKGKHIQIAQEIVVMLNQLFPESKSVLAYLDSMLSNTGNYVGRKLISSNAIKNDAIENLAEAVEMEYAKVPLTVDEYFLPPQKHIFDKMMDPSFSFSGPTSLGKSFLMSSFIRAHIEKKDIRNFYIILPTRALINEVKSQLIHDLGDLLTSSGYMVSTSPDDKYLNMIFVFTPERFLLHIQNGDCIHPDYIFIDEAQIISADKDRSLLYFKIIDEISRIQNTFMDPCFIFSSPNIPNPELYCSLFPDSAKGIYRKDWDSKAFRTSYSPVSHFIFNADFPSSRLSVYNSFEDKFEDVGQLDCSNLFELIDKVGSGKVNVVYTNSINTAFELTANYYERCKNRPNYISVDNQAKLDSAAKLIEECIHKDYFLAKYIRKGIAYHVSYLPGSVRHVVEGLLREGIITTIFCTSTIIQGVNFPADNLFVTTYLNGKNKLSQIEFKNLLGRAGRIRYSLFGNIYLVGGARSSKRKDYEAYCKTPVSNQEFYINTTEGKQKIRDSVSALLDGDLTLRGKAKSRFERKASTMLLRDLSTHDDSAFLREIRKIIPEENLNKLKNLYPSSKTYEELYISYDQISELEKYIANGGHFPKTDGARIDYNEVYPFMVKLQTIFNWGIYENDTLGNINKLKWYTVVLCKWVEGQTTAQIVRNELSRYESGQKTSVYPPFEKAHNYTGSDEDKNIIFNDVLKVINDVIIFKLTDYFRIFAKYYKKYHELKSSRFDNDWSEFVEFGTTNWKLVELQKIGYSRDSAKEILDNYEDELVYFNEEGTPCLEVGLLEVNEGTIALETEEIMKNRPRVFDYSNEDF